MECGMHPRGDVGKMSSFQQQLDHRADREDHSANRTTNSLIDLVNGRGVS